MKNTILFGDMKAKIIEQTDSPYQKEVQLDYPEVLIEDTHLIIQKL